jgi:hypothetical protein
MCRHYPDRLYFWYSHELDYGHYAFEMIHSLKSGSMENQNAFGSQFENLKTYPERVQNGAKRSCINFRDLLTLRNRPMDLREMKSKMAKTVSRMLFCIFVNFKSTIVNGFRMKNLVSKVNTNQKYLSNFGKRFSNPFELLCFDYGVRLSNKTYLSFQTQVSDLQRFPSQQHFGTRGPRSTSGLSR